MKLILKTRGEHSHYNGHTFKIINHSLTQVMIVIDEEKVALNVDEFLLCDLQEIREHLKANPEIMFRDLFRHYVLKNGITFPLPQMKLF
jgi:hypothetical protein